MTVHEEETPVAATPVDTTPAPSPSAEILPTTTPTPGATVEAPSPETIELVFPEAAAGPGADVLAIVVAVIAAAAAILAAVMAYRASTAANRIATAAVVVQDKSAKRRDLWDQINWSVDTALSHDPISTRVGIRSALELLDESWITSTDRRRVLALVSEIVP